MGYKVALASQKGGVGKSTLARLIAREAAVNNLSVKIADLDVRQSTCAEWAARRIANGVTPAIRVESFGAVSDALREADQFDVFVFDGAPQASKQTLELAKAVDLLILPSSTSYEDRVEAVKLANELYKRGIPPQRIAFALCLTGKSKVKLREARNYFTETQYLLLDGEMPERDSFEELLEFGRAPTETPYRTLRERTDLLAQSAIDALVTTTQPRTQEVA